jgi:hypothetical protein
VLEVGQDGILFCWKSPETIPLPFNTCKIIPPPFQQISNHPVFLFRRYETALGIIIIVLHNSNINMQSLAVMKLLHLMLAV